MSFQNEPVIPGLPQEGRSSMGIEQNSKGEPAVKIKLYSDSNDFAALDATANKLVEMYRGLVAEVGA